MAAVAVASPTTGRKVWLAIGGVLTAAVLLLELYFGAALTYGWFWPFPPAWPGVFLSLIAALAGPLATVLTWRSGRRRSAPNIVTLGRMELVGFNIGLLCVLVLFGMLVVAAPF